MNSEQSILSVETEDGSEKTFVNLVPATTPLGTTANTQPSSSYLTSTPLHDETEIEMRRELQMRLQNVVILKKNLEEQVRRRANSTCKFQ